MAKVGFSDICGSGELVARTIDDIKNDRVGHAYIIDGPNPDMSLAFALDFAAAVLCMGDGEKLPCGECPSCVRFDAGSHPDIMVVDRGERASVGVDFARMMRDDSAVIPSESERKIYIINEAERMTPAAENALLRTLEEPPAYVLFLLTTSDSSSLLPTVRSRAVTLHMQAPTRDELFSYVRRECAGAAGILSDEKKREELYLLSGGSPKTAVEYAKNEKKLSERMLEKSNARELLGMMLSGSADACPKIYSMGKIKSDAAGMLLYDMKCAVRDMIAVKRTANAGTIFFVSREEALNAGRPYGAAGLAAAMRALNDSETMIKSNVSPTAVLMTCSAQIKNAIY